MEMNIKSVLCFMRSPVWSYNTDLLQVYDCAYTVRSTVHIAACNYNSLRYKVDEIVVCL